MMAISLPAVHIDSLMLHYVVFWQPLAYGLIFLGMIIEGDIFLFTAGFLVAQGLLGVTPTFLALLGGVLIGDLFWYWLGYRICCSQNFINRWITRSANSIDNHLLTRTLRTIFISKFIYGLHHLVLIRVGIIRIPYQKFIKVDLISVLAWIGVVGSLGYLSGASFALIRHYFRYLEVTLILAIILFLILDYLLVKYELKKNL